jgi:hypothetical protein
MIIQVYLTKFGTIQSMKVQNLKQPFMLQAIVTIFGESFFFWKFVEFSFQNGEFVTEFFLKMFFTKWQNFITKRITK